MARGEVPIHTHWLQAATDLCNRMQISAPSRNYVFNIQGYTRFPFGCHMYSSNVQVMYTVKKGAEELKQSFRYKACIGARKQLLATVFAAAAASGIVLLFLFLSRSLYSRSLSIFFSLFPLSTNLNTVVE